MYIRPFSNRTGEKTAYTDIYRTQFVGFIILKAYYTEFLEMKSIFQGRPVIHLVYYKNFKKNEVLPSRPTPSTTEIQIVALADQEESSSIFL